MTTPSLAEGTGAQRHADLESARRRARWLLMAGASLGSTMVIMASTVGAIAARDILDDTALAGTAGAAIIVGTAIGTSALAALMARRGHRLGLWLGYAVAVVGGGLAAWAVIDRSFIGLLIGALLLGFANSSTQLSRYVAAGLATADRRASAIGLVVWAATIGAVLGPALVPLTGAASASLGLPELAGPYLAATLIASLTATLLALWLRPDPVDLAVDPIPVEQRSASGIRIGDILRRPSVGLAVTVMVVGQVVMVAIMAMTPLHMTDHGHGLGVVGFVISAHVLGMFALSPLSGRIADRIGSISTILLGTAILAVATLMAAAAPPEGGTVLTVALFLLGYGWNLGFVSGSALLTGGLEPAERTRAQGIADSFVWGSSALASLLAGVVLAVVGYAALGLLGAALLVIPVAAVLRLHNGVRPAAAAS